MLKKVSDLKDGDVFEWQGKRHVAIEDYGGGDCLWVTIPQYYIYPDQDGNYGYTSACVLSIQEYNVVKVLRNLLEEIKSDLKEPANILATFTPSKKIIVGREIKG